MLVNGSWTIIKQSKKRFSVGYSYGNLHAEQIYVKDNSLKTWPNLKGLEEAPQKIRFLT